MFVCTDDFGALRLSRKAYDAAARPVTSFDRREMLPVSEDQYDEEFNSYYVFAVWADSPESSPVMWAYY